MHERAQQDLSIAGEVFNSHDRPPRRFSPGRRCAELECNTLLSVYNDSDRCSLHRVDMTLYMRGATY